MKENRIAATMSSLGTVDAASNHITKLFMYSDSDGITEVMFRE